MPAPVKKKKKEKKKEKKSDWKILMNKHEYNQLMHIKFVFEEPLYRNCIALYLYLI